ncbi:MAG: hypothetical protein H7343_11015 [Undibacterium sp.]|nr:hypothetical protein [Opitutaceae bacterium]
MREKFADEGEAMTEARTKAAQLRAGRLEGAAMTSADREELQAARKLTDGFPVLAALDEWAKARKLTAGKVIAAAESWAAKNGKVEVRVKVETVVKEFLKLKTAAGKNVASDHKHSFALIVSDLGQFNVDAVTSRQLDAWLAKSENPVTRNTRRKRLVSVWRWAQRKSYLPRDGRTEAEMTERAHEPAPIIGIIDVATWHKVLAYFEERHPDYLAALVIAGFCGLRRGEVQEQTWEDISTERRVLRVTHGKRGTPARRMVPLCDAALVWLARCKGEHTGPISPAFALDRIRLYSRRADPAFELPENCFRHSYISHAVAATGDIPRVSLDAGNSPKEINRHYRELVSEEDGKAWFAVTPE